jgi:hypothetical protein
VIPRGVERDFARLALATLEECRCAQFREPARR